MNRVAFLVLPIFLLLPLGCKKSSPGPATQTTTQQDPVVEQSSASSPDQPPLHAPPLPPTPAAPKTIQDNGNTDAVLGQLSQELRKYVVRTRQAPKNFEEFIATSHVQAPPPPPGKKYVIERGVIILKNT
ncbi:MAG TPA: hypothetical protein VLT36_09320 [Candidatus Dormibacteraeota bacterium]|nr:hypothetical protein [Candidatus Dormibacteraeota bacterium]